MPHDNLSHYNKHVNGVRKADQYYSMKWTNTGKVSVVEVGRVDKTEQLIEIFVSKQTNRQQLVRHPQQRPAHTFNITLYTFRVYISYNFTDITKSVSMGTRRGEQRRVTILPSSSLRSYLISNVRNSQSFDSINFSQMGEKKTFFTWFLN